MDRRAWGIDEGYHDHRGEWRVAPDASVQAVVEALGAGESGPPPVPLRFVRPHTHVPVDAVEVVLEDGNQVAVRDGVLPPDLPLGYHCLIGPSGSTTALIVTPGRAHLPPNLRTWGWAVQLYALRSRASWGMGDLADLRRVARWSRESGAGLAVVSPMGAVLPVADQQPSPYFPSSRRWHNPLYLRIEEVPGAGIIGDQLGALARAGQALNSNRRIDRNEVFRLKSEALVRIWESTPPLAGFDAWRASQGKSLTAFSTFCALTEEHDRGWSEWPGEHRHPASPAVAEFATKHADTIRFHQWTQWLFDRQLAVAGAELPLIADLPIGFDPSGVDAWEWQDVLALGMRVGAPPDEFNTQGQDWGLPPFDPWRLRAVGYQPFVETLRATLRRAGGVRVDHVMGLWRLFWVPDGAGPAAGVYVRYRAGELLDLLALESVRAGAVVVGEDLGTVEPGVREELLARGVLSTRLVWFEHVPPEQYPEQALAAVTTHDLATLPGLWTGADLAVQVQLGLRPNHDATHAQRARLRDLAGVAEDATIDEVVVATYRRLAAGPSAVVTANLDDALGVTERPNQPGTVDEWPNWRLGLPEPLDSIEGDERVLGVARVLDEDR